MLKTEIFILFISLFSFIKNLYKTVKIKQLQ